MTNELPPFLQEEKRIFWEVFENIEKLPEAEQKDALAAAYERWYRAHSQAMWLSEPEK